MATEGETGTNLTDPEWRALVYAASQHGFSAPHLRLEEGEEALEVEAHDVEGLRGALGRALEARDVVAIKTPDGELARPCKWFLIALFCALRPNGLPRRSVALPGTARPHGFPDGAGLVGYSP